MISKFELFIMSKEFKLEIPDGYYEKMSEIQELLNQADEINKKLNNFPKILRAPVSLQNDKWSCL